MKQPKKLSLEMMFENLPHETKHNHKIVSTHGEIGVVIGINYSLFSRFVNTGMPYLLEDYRLGLVQSGSMRGIINLQEKKFTEGDIIFISPGTIVEPISASEDFCLAGVAMSAEKFYLVHGDKVPEMFNGQMRNGHRHICHEEKKLMESMLQMLRNLMNTDDMSERVIYNMVATITSYYNQLFTNRTDVQPPSRPIYLFNNFLHLVNLHCRQQHQLSFYAGKLCITERYLGTLIKATSGVSAKEWIDRAIISIAKVMLRHSDYQTSQIADELHFPNASFFCKYFRRLTGMTPQQYRSLTPTFH